MQQAFDCFNQAIGLDARLPAAYINRAIVDYQRSQLKVGEIPTRGLDDIATAIRLGPANGEVYFLAACMAARGAALDEKQWLQRTLDYVGQAVNFGIDPRRIREDAEFKPLLNYAKFQQLTERPSPAAATEEALPRLVDPIPEEQDKDSAR
jgi:hypothetical protein